MQAPLKVAYIPDKFQRLHRTEVSRVLAVKCNGIHNVGLHICTVLGTHPHAKKVNIQYKHCISATYSVDEGDELVVESDHLIFLVGLRLLVLRVDLGVHGVEEVLLGRGDGGVGPGSRT